MQCNGSELQFPHCNAVRLCVPPPPNSYVKILPPKVMAIGGGPLGGDEAMRGHSCGISTL